jgi:Putative zinc-finger
MNCERALEQIPEVLAGRLEGAARERLIEHLDTCAGCRAQVAELGVVWRGLEAMAQPEPSPAMKSRFLETLHAYEEGFQEAQRRLTYTAPKRSWFWQPAWQVAFASVLLAAGLASGRYLLPHGAAAVPAGNPEIAQLRGQVDTLRQMVALSLLQEQSPSSRLRGVTYSYQMTQPDRDVAQALLHAVNQDTNVNVRLSAVDALAKFASDPEVRRALADSLAVQDSPLVQIALIDLLVQLQAREGVPVILKLSQDKDANEAVRQRAVSALEKLGRVQ